MTPAPPTNPSSSGTLFLVATPIGDDADLSPRARAVLEAVDCVAAEDTRVTAALLRRVGLRVASLTSYHDHNEHQRAAHLSARLAQGDTVALVSDAGTPLVSDPGYRLVLAAIAVGAEVVSVPGPCAAVAALAGSGLPPDRFVFLGFLPRESGPRRAALVARRDEPATLVLHVAPHRLSKVLGDLAELWGDRPVALARNLTKEDAAWFRGPISAVIATLEAQEEGTWGEYTLVVGGAPSRGGGDEGQLRALVAGLARRGVSPSVLRDVVSDVYDRPRRWVYQLALAAMEDDPR